jgi:hypothetical protein
MQPNLLVVIVCHQPNIQTNIVPTRGEIHPYYHLYLLSLLPMTVITAAITNILAAGVST